MARKPKIELPGAFYKVKDQSLKKRTNPYYLKSKANGSSLLLISFNGFPINVFGNDARVCKPYNEFISCKNLVISYCFLTFYELFQFIEGLILF